MTVSVELADEDALERWDRYVERSPQGTFFHQLDALEVQADHADADLYPLIGYKGAEPVGLFPVFVIVKGPIRTAFSPPPDLWIPYLGPAMLNMAKLSQRKAERRRRQFIDGVFEWLDAEIDPTYFQVRTSGRYEDLRPFQWNDCDVTVDYTYEVDLSHGTEEVMNRFSSDARRNVRKSNGADLIEEGDTDHLGAIIEQVRARYESQGLDFYVPTDFVTDLADRLDGGIRPYVSRVDGEFVGGIIALEFDDVVYRWQGGVRHDADVDFPVNDLLDWRVMTEGMERDRTIYDLVGANNPRINQYKAKFGPDLRPFYTVNRSSLVTEQLMKLYKRLR